MIEEVSVILIGIAIIIGILIAIIWKIYRMFTAKIAGNLLKEIHGVEDEPIPTIRDLQELAEHLKLEKKKIKKGGTYEKEDMRNMYG